MGLFDRAAIKLACPHCAKKFKKTVARLKRDLQCPGCGLAIKTHQFRRQIEQAEKSAADFLRGLGR
jgi:hypothetical protein